MSIEVLTSFIPFSRNFFEFHIENYVLFGPVAQWLERSAHNRLVAGSIPAGPTIIKGTTLICLN